MGIKENFLALNIPDDVILVGASKKQPVEKIMEAIGAGLKIIGENYVSEAEEKYKHLKGKVKFHMIGHLQSNKVKQALKIFDMVQTVDSLKLAEKINELVENPYPILIQVNIGKEEQKHGILPEDLDEFVAKLKKLKYIQIKGLMCIPPADEDPRPYFQQMHKLCSKYDFSILSMGMSDDYKIAIEEGSNMVRIGTKLFGSRD